MPRKMVRLILLYAACILMLAAGEAALAAEHTFLLKVDGCWT